MSEIKETSADCTIDAEGIANEEDVKVDECSICLNSVINIHKTSCGHTFCKECITKWSRINNTCPNCRADLPPPSKSMMPSLADISSMFDRIRNPDIYNRLLSTVINCNEKEYDKNKPIDRSIPDKGLIRLLPNRT